MLQERLHFSLNNMTEVQLEKLQKTIKDQIETTVKLVVNGKIDRLNDKLDNYIITDNQWKEDAQPSIDLGKNVNGFGRVLAYILGTIAGIYGIIKIFK